MTSLSFRDNLLQFALAIDYKHGSIWSQTIGVNNSDRMGFIILTGEGEDYLSASYMDMEVDDSSSVHVIDEDFAEELLRHN